MRLLLCCVTTILVATFAPCGASDAANKKSGNAPAAAESKAADAGKPVLKGATLSLHTSAGEKRIDTCLAVTVEAADGKVLAQVKHAGCSDDKELSRLRFIKNSEHTLSLDVSAWAEDSSNCKGFKVRISQEGTARGAWEFDAKVTLKFADGTTLVAEKAGITFSNVGDSAMAEFSNGD